MSTSTKFLRHTTCSAHNSKRTHALAILNGATLKASGSGEEALKN